MAVVTSSHDGCWIVGRHALSNDDTVSSSHLVGTSAPQARTNHVKRRQEQTALVKAFCWTEDIQTSLVARFGPIRTKWNAIYDRLYLPKMGTETKKFSMWPRNPMYFGTKRRQKDVQDNTPEFAITASTVNSILGRHIQKWLTWTMKTMKRRLYVCRYS